MNQVHASVLIRWSRPSAPATWARSVAPATRSSAATSALKVLPDAFTHDAGALDLAEALPIARQAASALEAAHERGIVHRDLKPANIKVRDDGVVRVLDFGLAKEITAMPAGDIANSPTVTMPAQTARGELLGTAAHMSPEQARGKPVDRRADI